MINVYNTIQGVNSKKTAFLVLHCKHGIKYSLHEQFSLKQHQNLNVYNSIFWWSNFVNLINFLPIFPWKHASSNHASKTIFNGIVSRSAVWKLCVLIFAFNRQFEVVQFEWFYKKIFCYDLSVVRKREKKRDTWRISVLQHHCHPLIKLWEGNFFRPVCLSFCSRG